MGAGASIEDVNAENERETCDKLFDRLNKTGGDSLNFMELKKGFEEIEKEEGIHVKMTAKKFAHFADANDDKVVDKEEFYGMMKKVKEKGDIEQDKAATMLQAKARQRAATAEVQDKRDQKNAATVLQSKQRQKAAVAEVQDKRDQNNAATKLQSKQRQKAAVAEVQDKRDQNNAATKLQSKARQQQAKKEVDAKRESATGSEGEAKAEGEVAEAKAEGEVAEAAGSAPAEAAAEAKAE